MLKIVTDYTLTILSTIDCAIVFIILNLSVKNKCHDKAVTLKFQFSICLLLLKN